jgi:outer membrane cobalamin receptor
MITMPSHDGRGTRDSHKVPRLPIHISSLLTLLLALGSCAVAAATASAAVQLPEEQVVGSAVYESDESDEDKYLSPGSITVIRPEDFEGEQRTLPDLLEEVPGLRIIRLQGRHGYAVASVRGSTSAQVAVYVDGILMNLQSESAVDLSAIPIDNVARVEVYKGYIPARFGAQAMGGVINIVTKNPPEPETTLSLGAGSFGRYKGTLSYGAPFGERGGKFFGSFGYETYNGDFKYWNDGGTPYNNTDDYNGRRRGNGFENTDILLKWEDEHWKARASWVRRNRDLPLVAPGLDKPGEPQRQGALLDTDRWDLSLGRIQSSGAVDWGWEVLYTGQTKNYDSRRGDAPSQIGGMNVTKSEYDTSRLGLSLNASRAVGGRHFLEFLGEYSDERLNVKGDSLFEYLNGIDSYSREDWDFNLQDTIMLDRAGTFLVTPSIRWHKQEDDDHFTWQVALTKEALFGSPEWMLKSTYGTYARSPNTYEQYGDGAFILPAASDIEWETGTQFDIGLIWTGTRESAGGVKANASLSTFWRDSENLIEFDMENPRFGRYQNIAKATVKGVEFESGFDWARWNFSLSGTWMEGENRTPGDEGSVRHYGLKLPNRPEWSGTARLTHKFWGMSETGERKDATVFVEYQYIGENYADSSQKVLFDARNVWNIGVKYDISPTTQFVAGVDDVFNDADDWRMRPDGLNGPTRMLWYPVEGRTFYLTMNFEL